MAGEEASYEPGVTLGRLIAAERNAMAAYDMSEKNNASQLMATGLIEKLEKQITDQQQQIAALRKLIVTKVIGTGPTS